MKRNLYIVLILMLGVAGIFASCKKPPEVTPQPQSTDVHTPLPSILKISEAPITFIFSQSEAQRYDSLYHQLAYLQMDSKGYNISNMYVEPEQDMQSAFAQLEQGGTEYVVVTSTVLNEQVQVFLQSTSSNMVFMQHGDYYMDDAFSYGVKMYEYYYLSGIALCSESTSKVAGFVASNPDEQTIRCINAFALGMKSMDKDAVVIVSWADNPADKNHIALIVENLSYQQCDVFGYFMPSDLVESVAANSGVYYMTMSTHTKLGKEKLAIKPSIDLEIYYANLMNVDKVSTPYDFRYLGISENVVSYELSGSVTEKTKNSLASANSNILSGYEVFSGPIYSDLGLIVPEGTILPEADILDMLWFVDNVIGQLPAG